MDVAGMQRRLAGQPQRGRRPQRSAELVRLRRQWRRAVRQQAWAQVQRLGTLYRRQAQRERRHRRGVRGQRLARLLREDPAAFFQRFRTPRAQAMGRIPRGLWLQHFQRLLGEPPPALPLPPPMGAEGAAAGEPMGAPPGGQRVPPASQPGLPADAVPHEFTPAEVEAAIRRTRNRASVVGPLKPIVAKRAAHLLAPVLADLFSACARVGQLPDFWACSSIAPIPKPGADSSQCSGHRGIAVGTLPAKLYASVLERQLCDWAEGAGVRAEGQFGFRPRRGCAQAALVLRATIERVRARGERLYACFVDFQKAYDTVPRHLLWARLRQAGVAGSCIAAVQALYANVPMCVRTPDGCSDTFQSLLGLKQGCPLSPTLFGMYVDNLAEAVMYGQGADLPVLGDGECVPPLMYADDLALLSTTAEGLQRQLAVLGGYSGAWGLTVNVQKTKVVVFEGSGRRAASAGEAFTYEGQSLDTADEFRYLGIQFHRSLAFTSAATARAAAGAAAVHATRRRCAELGLRGAPVQLHLFNTMVLPALSYGAEVWSPQLLAAGGQCAGTRVQHAFLRQLLGVRQSTPGLVLLAETGQRPVAARWAAQLGRFWNSALDAPEGSLVRRALLDSSALASEAAGARLARQPWAQQVAAALGTWGAEVSVDQPQPVHVPGLVEAGAAAVRVQLAAAQGTRAVQYVAATGADGARDMPRYLRTLEHRGRWRELAQLRTGSHWLAEETGRWQQQQRAQRVCPHCAAAGEEHVQDAAHAIFHCPHNADLRAHYPQLFTPAHTASLYSFFTFPDPVQLSSFCRSLRRSDNP